jgi:hypothetical protein
VAADVESARRDWEEAHRRLSQVETDPRAAGATPRQLRALTDELRKRVGSTFTLQELAAEYAHADDWARDAASEATYPGWLSSVAIVEGAAFHLYSRGASDYEP